MIVLSEIRESTTRANQLFLQGNLSDAWSIIEPYMNELSSDCESETFAGEALWKESQPRIDICNLCYFYVTLYNRSLRDGAEGVDKEYLVNGEMYDKILSIYQGQSKVSPSLLSLIFQTELDNGTSYQLLRTQMKQLFKKIDPRQAAYSQLVEFYVLQVLVPLTSIDKIRTELKVIYGDDSETVKTLIKAAVPLKVEERARRRGNKSNGNKSKSGTGDTRNADKRDNHGRGSKKSIPRQENVPSNEEEKSHEEKPLTLSHRSWNLDIKHLDRSAFFNMLHSFGNWSQLLKLGSVVVCLVVFLVSLKRKISLPSARRIVLSLIRQIAETLKMAFTISYV